MPVNLAKLRAQHTPKTFSAEFKPDDPRRLQHLSLEQQKKRAKELLKQVRAAEPSACERLRLASLPLSEPRLCDAQRVIAHEHGFRKWEELKGHVDHLHIARQAVADGHPSALDGDRPTLHIRCGNDIMHKLAVAGFTGDFLLFCDPYIFGPLPQTDSLEEFVRIRTEAIDVPFEEIMVMYRELAQAHSYARVVIWNEYDAFDQLILARLLAHFSAPGSHPPHLQFINVTAFPGVEIFNGIGQLPPEALRVLWHEMVDVGKTELLAGKAAWAALTAPTPEALSTFVSHDPQLLPVMRRALRRHLQELPWTSNGLSLSEQTTLRILKEKGAMTAARLFGWFQNHYDPLPGMGDLFYWKLVDGLAAADAPAIRLHRQGDKPNQWQCTLTDLGERLLQNRLDWLTVNPIQRWVGGVYIDSRAAAHWRWHAANETVVEMNAAGEAN